MSVNETLSKKVYRTLKTIDGSGNKTWNKLAFWTTADQVELDNGDNAQDILESILMRNISIYISTTGSDITGIGTVGSPYRTFAKALSVCPKNMNGFDISLYVDGGTYDEDVVILGLGGGTFTIILNGNITINRLEVQETSSVNISQATIYTITTTVTTNSAVTVTGNSFLRLYNTNLLINSGSGHSGILVILGSNFYMQSGTATINNASNGIRCSDNSTLFVNVLAGSSNSIGIFGEHGSEISYGTKTISATTEKLLTGGSIITNDLVTQSQIGAKVIVSATAPSDTSAVWVY